MLEALGSGALMPSTAGCSTARRGVVGWWGGRRARQGGGELRWFIEGRDRFQFWFSGLYVLWGVSAIQYGVFGGSAWL